MGNSVESKEKTKIFHMPNYFYINLTYRSFFKIMAVAMKENEMLKTEWGGFICRFISQTVLNQK
jgi:hypothetical protein